MEAAPLLNLRHHSSSPPHAFVNAFSFSFPFPFTTLSLNTSFKFKPSSYPPLTLTRAAVHHIPAPTSLTGTSNSKDLLPKVDKSGRFCSPRAARELALMVLYAACLDGSDPVRLFERRLNARRETGYEFDKAALMEYNHMAFGGPPVTTESAEEADEILRNDQKESEIEAEVLSAPLKLVYSKLILRFTRKLLVAVSQNWDSNVLAIDTIAPLSWKTEAGSKILEFSILHLAMSEITVVGTRHQIVINEAVDLAKRFCDGAAPRVINGCLRSFVKEARLMDKNVESSQ